ncbi:VWA domain-containing protein [Methylovirgula sp. 4M-Z18]|uniref:VWA domain-containing protein n=1 Tax=Methylovirgula sp. 4M-Z18 TaxID=2293567 RepID=UPI000E2F3144|nr:VWA domain-containing protein [Methylovirgula sp. 4M-Z18]RFB80722.1 VWA domain-containing protein [Methylovirgula sp. 4M-Z18]
MQFKLESFFNPHLPPGSRRMDAVLTVTASGAAQSSARRAVAIVLDNSTSMEIDQKMEAAKHAARRCIDLLPAGTLFCVVTFGTQAHVIMPLCEANDANRGQAHHLVQRITANGATFMSYGLETVRREFAKAPGAICYAYFLTDGQNNGDDTKPLERAINACKGVYQCDCRGVGVDWAPAQLRQISTALLGTADAVPKPEALEADFKACLARALAKGTGKVKLQIWRPASSRLVSLHQMNPEDIDILGLGQQVDPRTWEVSLGAWGTEARDYHAVFEIEAGEIADEMLVCRPSIRWDGDGSEEKAAGQPVVATWSNDADLTARINPEVAHYTGQAELASSIKEGLEARDRGNFDEATKLLGKAAKIAAESGNEEVTRRLSKVVDLVDASEGTVRLKRDAGKAEALELEMGGTRTVRRAKQSP